jgi:hypothetical protein
VKKYNRNKLKAHDNGINRHSKSVSYDEKQQRLAKERGRAVRKKPIKIFDALRQIALSLHKNNK